MALSSSTVFVIVEDDLRPNLRGAGLLDATGSVISKPGLDVQLAVKPATSSDPGEDVDAAWEDSPTNRIPVLEWTAGNKRVLGSHYGRWLTDPDGAERQSYPTEEPFTIVVVPKTGA